MNLNTDTNSVMEIKIINNVRCYVDKGIAMLNLEDVGRGLGIVEMSNAGRLNVRWRNLRQYLKDLGVIATSCDGIGKQNLPEYIAENVFYKLCMKANNDFARDFQNKVCDEILPTIRKTGTYIDKNTYDKLIKNPEKFGEMLVEYGKLMKENELLKLSSIEKEEKISILEPKASYHDLILKSPELLSITTIAKDYGMSGKELNKVLHDLAIQYKQGEMWFLYQKYSGYGYTQSKVTSIMKPDGTSTNKTHTYWTQKGHLFLYNALKSNGILPLIEKS